MTPNVSGATVAKVAGHDGRHVTKLGEKQFQQVCTPVNVTDDRLSANRTTP
jgi:hypothetical protein